MDGRYSRFVGLSFADMNNGEIIIRSWSQSD